jgi:hypothetical protein
MGVAGRVFERVDGGLGLGGGFGGGETGGGEVDGGKGGLLFNDTEAIGVMAGRGCGTLTGHG